MVFKKARNMQFMKWKAGIKKRGVEGRTTDKETCILLRAEPFTGMTLPSTTPKKKKKHDARKCDLLGICPYEGPKKKRLRF